MTNRADVRKGPFGWEWYAACWCTLVGEGGYEDTHAKAMQKALWHQSGRCSDKGPAMDDLNLGSKR